LNIEATVGLYRSVVVLVTETNVGVNGAFLLEDVPPGNYLLRTSAPGYGSKELDTVDVEVNRLTDIGELLLSTLPWPLSRIFPSDGATGIYIQTDLTIQSSKPLDFSSIQEGLSVDPAPADFHLWYETEAYEYDTYIPFSVFCEARWDYETTYTVTLDTVVTTDFGRSLEFPLVSSFSVVPFQLKGVSRSHWDNLPRELYLSFNGNVTLADFRTHVSIDPDPGVAIEQSGFGERHTRFTLEPQSLWAPGTTQVTLSAGILEEGGAVIAKDTVVVVEWDDFSVVETFPENGQSGITTTTVFTIKFNANINDSTALDAFSINPPVGLSVSIYKPYYFNDLPRIYVDPGGDLAPGTTYTVTVDTTIQDIWGNFLATPYTFWFTTE
jgi:hypothetical protein